MSLEKIQEAIQDAQDHLNQVRGYLEDARKWAADIDRDDLESNLDCEIDLVNSVDRQLGKILTRSK